MSKLTLLEFESNAIDDIDQREEKGCLCFCSDKPFKLSAKLSGYFEWSFDRFEWFPFLYNTVLDVQEGTVYLRGSGNDCLMKDLSLNGGFEIKSKSKVEVIGDIMNLLDYTTVLSGDEPEMEDFCFYGLFRGCSTIVKGPRLSALNLSNGCYQDMFDSCLSLAAAPNLPAKVLPRYCYKGMFKNCSSLTRTPHLNSTELGNQCYDSMFKDCVNIKHSCDLPASKVPVYAYREMFKNCENLFTPPLLGCLNLNKGSLNFMFAGCSSLEKVADIRSSNYNAMTAYGIYVNCDGLEKVCSEDWEYWRSLVI